MRDSSVFNLSEKSIPIPKDYAYDVYVSLRQLNWGWGTWANRWQLVNWDKSQIPNFMLSTKQVVIQKESLTLIESSKIMLRSLSKLLSVQNMIKK